MQFASEPESDGEHEPEANVLSEPESAASDTEGSYPGWLTLRSPRAGA